MHDLDFDRRRLSPSISSMIFAQIWASTGRLLRAVSDHSHQVICSRCGLAADQHVLLHVDEVLGSPLVPHGSPERDTVPAPRAIAFVPLSAGGIAVMPTTRCLSAMKDRNQAKRAWVCHSYVGKISLRARGKPRSPAQSASSSVRQHARCSFPLPQVSLQLHGSLCCIHSSTLLQHCTGARLVLGEKSEGVSVTLEIWKLLQSVCP